MNLTTKPDFDKVLQRFEAWWQCQIVDRPPVTLGIRRPQTLPKPPPLPAPASLKDKWMNVQQVVDRHERAVGLARYDTDRFPLFYPNLGPDIVATLFGAELEFAESTSWSVPCFESCRQIIGRRPNFNNPYWRCLRELTAESIRRGYGRWITGMTDLHTNADVLSALRGPQNLCMEVADDPEGVRLACQYVTDLFAEIFEDCYAPVAAAGMPATTWINTLHMGRMYVTSCDFICMISPKDFQEIVQPCLLREMQHLDRNIFHLDGPGALRHLDALLSMKELDGIQWVYGSGNEPSTRWVDVYKRIQAAGKCQQVICGTMAEAEQLMERLRPQGVWFSTAKTCSEEEASQFIARLERWK